MHPLLQPLLLDQSGVVSRRQALDAGLTVNDIKRLVRRRDLVAIHPGVYVDHTGEPTWHQDAWAAVLLLWPAALTHGSALRAAEGPGSKRRRRPIEVAVAEDRHVVRRSGIRVVRRPHLDDRVQWNLGPPRMRYEEAALDVAAESTSDFDAIAELSQAVQGRRTTAVRLLDVLEGRDRIARRDWMRRVLEDVRDGTCSVLEHGYLHRVERPHGLARPHRQVRDRVGPGVVYRDVLYECGLVAELDGRLFHDTTRQRDRDMDRDLMAAVAGKDSVRLSYGQVYDRPCWTAAAVDVLLRSRGSSQRGHPCGPSCWVGRLTLDSLTG